MFETLFRLRLKVALAFVATLAMGAFLVHLNERNHVLQTQKVAADVAAIHGHLLQERVDRSLSATYALAAVLRQGNGRIDNFDELAGEMLRLYGGLSALQLAPKGVISRIVPLAGNEAAMGHNLLQDPARNKEAFAAVRTKKLTLAGPFTLRQGGVAVIGRLPVFLTMTDGSEEFWGFTTALVRIGDLLEAAKLDTLASAGYRYELSRIHPDTGKLDVFAGSSPVREPVSFVVQVPNAEWTLSIAPVGGWHSAPLALGIESLVVLLTALLAALLAYKVLQQPLVLRTTNAALTQEIEERKRVEAALQDEQARQETLIHRLGEAQNQLLQSEKMASIGQLAAGVAHEINNPIGFVNSNLNALKGDIDDLLAVVAAYEQAVDPLLAERPQLQAVVDAVKGRADLAYLREDLPTLLKETQDGVVRVKKIVQDLKEFSHVDSGEWELSDLHKGLDSTLNVVWNELKYKAEVVKDYGAIPPVECLPSQLNQVFMNLLVNAAQAIDSKGRITIRSTRDGDGVRIDVADTGKGIPADNINRIFEPFFTTKPVGKGTGLGLSLSYSIVQKHGGKIEVQSEVGKGTVFSVWLPLQRAAVPVDEPAAAGASGCSASA